MSNSHYLVQDLNYMLQTPLYLDYHFDLSLQVLLLGFASSSLLKKESNIGDWGNSMVNVVNRVSILEPFGLSASKCKHRSKLWPPPGIAPNPRAQK